MAWFPSFIETNGDLSDLVRQIELCTDESSRVMALCSFPRSSGLDGESGGFAAQGALAFGRRVFSLGPVVQCSCVDGTAASHFKSGSEVRKGD